MIINGRLQFQSTHPHGVRRYDIATLFQCRLPGFQSTHPHGVRLLPFPELVEPDRFQSTHPHGVRHIQRLDITSCQCFNPRTHTGCDVTIGYKIDKILVSIHAPTRGATRAHSFQSYDSTSFNPRTHTGCDHVLPSPCLEVIYVSIHAPTRGATPAHAQPIKQ